MLSKPDVQVTNNKDKETMLPYIFDLQEGTRAKVKHSSGKQHANA